MKSLLQRMVRYIRVKSRDYVEVVRTERRMLNRIAEEGYETASDILFPNGKPKHEKLHYGPVLPN